MLHSLRLRFTDKPLTLVVTGVEKWAPERSKRHGRRDGSDFQTSGRRLQRRAPHRQRRRTRWPDGLL